MVVVVGGVLSISISSSCSSSGNNHNSTSSTYRSYYFVWRLPLAGSIVGCGDLR